MKVSELTGAPLDYWVAQAEGIKTAFVSIKWDACVDSDKLQHDDDMSAIYSPSTNWAQGGPNIEREHISVEEEHPGCWFAVERYTKFGARAETLLVAAMRAYVGSQYGETVPDDPA